MISRRTGQAGLQLIRQFEGFSPTVYRCVAGYDTIGYGHRLRAGETFPQGLDESAAQALMQQDLLAAEQAIDRLLPVPLKDYQFDALASFTFNLGAAALQRSTLRQCILRHEHEAAAYEFQRWIYAGGKKQAGLIRRRNAESALYRGDQ